MMHEDNREETPGLQDAMVPSLITLTVHLWAARYPYDQSQRISKRYHAEEEGRGDFSVVRMYICYAAGPVPQETHRMLRK
ncbi:hypothetical protein PROFUN_15745 [Planoprotostelium fungivorum]|uniref:Uncharacterized protein n=1 Tax=Planoprotostelium fungivorum TaxID=1890364 RepID=A0A2P6MUT6_9EUKA|nr:hypothetical protein PROFUN_15745 [Planoprotostelium fungivorum]